MIAQSTWENKPYIAVLSNKSKLTYKMNVEYVVIAQK